MRANQTTGMQQLDDRRARRRLQLGISLFVLALAAPSGLLVFKAYDQMKWESFRAQQLVAEELADRIDVSVRRLVRQEDSRPVDDYRFLNDAAGDSGQRSPLAELHGADRIPGLIGYFEVASDGQFRSPLVPLPGQDASRLGISAGELTLRQARASDIQQVLIGNRLVEQSRPASDQGAAEAEIILSDEPAPMAASHLGAAGAGINQAATRDDLEQASPPEPAAVVASYPPEPAVNKETSQRLSQAAFERLKTKEGDFLRRADVGNGEPLKGLPQLDESYAKRSRRELKLEADKAYAAKSKMEPELASVLPPPAPIGFADREEARGSVAPMAEAQVQSGRDAVRLFQRPLGRMEVGLLDSGHLLLFRSVSQSSEQLIQGALIAQQPFLEALIAAPLANTVLTRTTHLSVAYRGEVLASFRAQPEPAYRFSSGLADLSSRVVDNYAAPLTGALLYRTRLPEPFGAFELVFSVSHLPTPPGAAVIGWMAAALALVLLVGAWLMFRLGARQLALVRQQQDFVSAVSHELKTPLTSIRLYAEMLREGFAPEERKATYYRFIHEESERLSRLINNVLQLARIGRGRLIIEPRPLEVDELLTMVRERVAHQIDRAGFALRIDCIPGLIVQADPDACVQILINLIDNALKFAANVEHKRIDIHCQPADRGQVSIGVRDYGPGIPKALRRRIFELFYRGEQATTGAISGTGIGLALVRRLIGAMHGRVEVIERQPGVEFQLELPAATHCPDSHV